MAFDAGGVALVGARDGLEDDEGVPDVAHAVELDRAADRNGSARAAGR